MARDTFAACLAGAPGETMFAMPPRANGAAHWTRRAAPAAHGSIRSTVIEGRNGMHVERDCFAAQHVD